MFALPYSSQKIEIPPHPIDLTFNQYPINTTPAQLERTPGNVNLYVAPKSDDAELMGAANISQGIIMDDRLSTLDAQLRDNEKEPQFGEQQLLDVIREKLELETKIGTLARLNTRLRGGIPDMETVTGIKTHTVLGATAILEQTAEKAALAEGRVRFSGLETLVILDNLELGAADLRQKARQESQIAATATHDAIKIDHNDRAHVLNTKADEMIQLRGRLIKSSHSVSARASVPAKVEATSVS